MLFALSRNLRDFSPVTNCRPRLPACQPASQPSSTPSRTRTRARGTKTSPPPSASAVPTVSNFPIAFWPRRRDLWALCKVGGIRSEFTQPLSTLCLRIISEYQLMLRARFVSSRFVISSFLPSFLPCFLILWLIEFRVGAAAMDRFPPLKPIRQSGSQFPHRAQRGNYKSSRILVSCNRGLLLIASEKVSVRLSVIQEACGRSVGRPFKIC